MALGLPVSFSPGRDDVPLPDPAADPLVLYDWSGLSTKYVGLFFILMLRLITDGLMLSASALRPLVNFLICLFIVPQLHLLLFRPFILPFPGPAWVPSWVPLCRMIPLRSL